MSEVFQTLSRIDIDAKLAKRVTEQVLLNFMREISPAVGLSADEYLNLVPAIRPIVEKIRHQKESGERRGPSVSLIDRSSLLSGEARSKLLDKIATLVDENLAGRSEMCQQFADLLCRALEHLQFPARGVVGTAIYYDPQGNETFRWNHAWVRVGQEVIDANVDYLPENPMVPKEVRVLPYWGPLRDVPTDRRLREDYGNALPADHDVDAVWWPELRAWIGKASLS